MEVITSDLLTALQQSNLIFKNVIYKQPIQYNSKLQHSQLLKTVYSNLQKNNTTDDITISSISDVDTNISPFNSQQSSYNNSADNSPLPSFVQLDGELSILLGQHLTTRVVQDIYSCIFTIFDSSILIMPLQYKLDNIAELKRRLSLDLVYKDYYTIFQYNKRHFNKTDLQLKILSTTTDMYVEKYIADYLNINIIVLCNFDKTYYSITEYNKDRITIILLKLQTGYKPIFSDTNQLIYDHDTIKKIMTTYKLIELPVNKILTVSKTGLLDICKYKLLELQQLSITHNLAIINTNNKKYTKQELYDNLKPYIN